MNQKGRVTSIQKTTVIALMAAAAVSTNYMLVGVINVKFMDLLVFTTGYMLGALSGATVGVLSWIVYGTLNPYGFSFPVLIATALSETLYGIMGGLVSSRVNVKSVRIDLRFAVIGFLLTFIYDLITNIVSILTAGIPLSVGLVAGVPFSLVHEVSNAAFFAICLPPLVHGIKHVLRFSQE